MAKTRANKKRRAHRTTSPCDQTPNATGDDQQLLAAFDRIRVGDHEGARQIGCNVLARQPENADAWHIVGMAFHCSGEQETALQALDEAVRVDRAGNGTIHCTRGSVLSAMGRHREALAAFRNAINCSPTLVEAHRNLGTSLITLHHYEQAELAFREAIRIEPNYGRAWSDLSTAELRQGKLEDALRSSQQAYALLPGDVAVRLNYGIILLRLQRLDEAISMLRHALQLDSRCAPAYHNLGNAFIAAGLATEAVQCFRAAKELTPAYASDYLFALSHDPTADAEFVRDEHFHWGDQLDARRVGAVHANSRDPDRRLRIGYVSPDFRDHVMARYILPIFRHHKRTEFEVVGYSTVPRPDPITDQIQSLADQWHVVAECNDSQLAQKIRDDRIDILVDLAGHTAGNRLSAFAYKPAPIQMTWLGYSNTTGLRAIDYRIASEYQDPIDSQGQHREQLMYVEGEGVCYEMPPATPDVGPLPALRNGYITFGSLHRLNKLSAATFDVWSQVLNAVPNSRLRVFWPTLRGEKKANIEHEFQTRGIPAERLELRHEADRDGYLSQYHDIDIGLDVTQWTGSTTTREALWMGVVVLGHLGDRRSSRGTATVLHYAGLDHCVARSAHEYVELATAMAARIDALIELRNNLRSQVASKLGDHGRQMRAVERALREAWRRWCQHHQATHMMMPQVELTQAFVHGT